MTTGSARRAIRRDDVAVLLARLSGIEPGTAIYLVGDTSQLWEGWLDRVPTVQLAGIRPALAAVGGSDLPIQVASPADVIPLPRGAAQRHRSATPPPGFPAGAALLHFDPCSVAFRAIARGDDPDYRTVLRYLRHGWTTLAEMDALLEDLLPRFTRETIAQDPAEFRRKYRGLCQMWRATA